MKRPAGPVGGNGASPQRFQGLRAVVWTLIIGILLLAGYYTWFGDDGGGSSLAYLTGGITSGVRFAGGDADAARGQEILRRFFLAKQHVDRLKAFGKHRLFPATECPADLGIGGRPENQKAPQYCGNTCEPWMARFGIVMLDHLLDTSMRALEWGTGSSSQWLLMRVGHLTSIEHEVRWADAVKATLGKMFPPLFLQQHWDAHAIPSGQATRPDLPPHEDPGRFAEYSGADFLPDEPNSLDYVAVDGRSRVACLLRALPLLRKQGGILLLDNSDRTKYQAAIDAVPSHWPRFDDEIVTHERTTIWISCEKGNCGENLALPVNWVVPSGP